MKHDIYMNTIILIAVTFILPFSSSCYCADRETENSMDATSSSAIISKTYIDFGSTVSAPGLVYKEYFYEQPNYGESPSSDVISDACIIKLDDKIILKSDKVIKKIHLLLPYQSSPKCSDLAGHRVEVSGVLEETYTGHHHGDALMEIKKYKILR
jgi:hypothetical protein